MVNNEGKYDHLLTRVEEYRYKLLMARIAVANELTEKNRLKRIQLAIQMTKLTQQERMYVETAIEEDIDLTDQG